MTWNTILAEVKPGFARTITTFSTTRIVDVPHV